MSPIGNVVLARLGRVSLMVMLLAALVASAGCTRRFFRNRADREVAEVLAEKDVFPDWKIEQYHVYPDGMARFADPSNPDRPPMPPDDPAAKMLAPNPQKPKHAGVGFYEGTGYLDLLAAWDAQNRAEAAPAGATPPPGTIKPVSYLQEVPAAGAPVGDKLLELAPWPRGESPRPFLITLEQAVELGLINSREYQTKREDLYLTALPVTLQRFGFAAQFFATEEAIRTWSGSRTPEGFQNNWAFNSSAGFSKLFSTGALLMFQFANRTVVDLSGNLPRRTTSVSNVNLDIVQPLLRGGGRAVTLEPLTQSERDLLYEIRDYARFREQFFANIATGGDLSVFNVQPVRQGYWPASLRQAQLEIDRKNYNDLRKDFKRFVALQEGGDIPPLQVETVKNQVLQAESTVLRDEQDLRDAIDAFKQQLGLPLDVPLELDLKSIEPVMEQVNRFEAVFEHMQQAKSFDAPPEGAKVRPALRQVLATYPLVQGTQFQKTILRRAAEFDQDKLPGNQLDKKLGELADQREKLLRQKTKADEVQAKGKAAETLWTAQAEAQLKQLEADINLGELERALRKYEAQPWLKEKDVLKAEQQREDMFGNVLHFFEVVLGEAQKERLDQARQQWPALPPIEIDGVNVLTSDLEPALDVATQTALTNRLDLMNARAQLVDAWRQIAVSANSLLGVFNIEYHLAGFSPAGEAKPLAVTGSHMRHQLAFNTELPLTRLPERNVYRVRLIEYQRERRNLMLAEDRVTAGVRGQIRQLQVLAENYRIQKQLVELAYYLRDSSREALLQPPPPGRQLDYASLTDQYLRNQSNLVQRQNGLYSLWTNYQITRLQLYRDLELMPLDSRGVWIDELSHRPQPSPPELLPNP